MKDPKKQRRNRNGGKGNRRRSDDRVPGKAEPGSPKDGKSEDTPPREDGSKNPFNDVSWYTRNPSLLLAAGSVPYPYRPGMVLDLGSFPSGGSAVKYSINVPGFMVIRYHMSIGRSETVVDPGSIIAKEMYGRVRAAFSGSLPEDPPDLFIYLMALDSIYSQIAEMKRLFRSIGQYFSDNYTFPSLLIAALTGLNPATDSAVIDNIVANKMLFFQQINELVGMVQKFTAPAIMHVMDRHYWLGDNIYADDNTLASQMYVFVNGMHYQFSLDSEGKGMLDGKTFTYSSSSGIPYTTQWFNHVRGMIEALASSEDAYTISGHLARAYEGERQFTVAPIAYNEVNIPQYIPEVLQQIENSRAVSVNVNSLQVKQDPTTNAVKSSPTVAPGSGDFVVKPVLSIRSPSPTVFDTVIASRLQAPDDGLLIYPATEVVYQYALYTGLSSAPLTMTSTIFQTEGGLSLNQLNFLSQMSKFDWSPFIYGVSSSAASPQMYFFGDIHNVTTFDVQTMANLNTVCLFSEFGAFNGI